MSLIPKVLIMYRLRHYKCLKLDFSTFAPIEVWLLWFMFLLTGNMWSILSGNQEMSMVLIHQSMGTFFL